MMEKQGVNREIRGGGFEITEEHLLRLPSPVRQYLASAGVLGRLTISACRLEQRGALRRGQRWLPFVAEQCFTTNPPEFVWRARVQFIPLLNLSVTDMFRAGHGRLEVKLFSRLKVVEAKGPEVDQGELLRYLGKLAWLPTAWLSSYIDWESVDARTARATVRLAGLSASAVLHFDEDSKLSSVSARRHMEESGRFVLREWSGHFGEYKWVGGLLLPLKASRGVASAVRRLGVFSGRGHPHRARCLSL